VNGKIWDRPVHCVYVFTKLVIKYSFLNQSLPTSTVWNFLRSKPSYNNVLGTSSLLLMVPPPAKAGGSHQNTMLIMWEPLIMQEPLIMRKPESGRSWTSKVFNTVITLDTYQFRSKIKCHCDFIIVFWANSYFIFQIHHAKIFKMRYIKSLYKPFWKIWELILLWGIKNSQVQTWKKILSNNIYHIAFDPI
jgi:hypothetical protein